MEKMPRCRIYYAYSILETARIFRTVFFLFISFIFISISYILAGFVFFFFFSSSSECYVYHSYNDDIAFGTNVFAQSYTYGSIEWGGTFGLTTTTRIYTKAATMNDKAGKTAFNGACEGRTTESDAGTEQRKCKIGTMYQL